MFLLESVSKMLITHENTVCFHVHVDEANPDNILKVWKDL